MGAHIVCRVVKSESSGAVGFYAPCLVVMIRCKGRNGIAKTFAARPFVVCNESHVIISFAIHF